jgi:catalase (peroxidase I)
MQQFRIVNVVRPARDPLQSDGKERFVRDFVKAWAKVTNLDRFDVART